MSPSREIRSTQVSPLSGSNDVHATDVTPGSRCTRSRIRSYSAERCGVSGYRDASGAISTATTPSGENPGSIRSRRTKLDTRSAVTTSRVTDNATCIPSSVARTRCPPRSVAPWPPARSAAWTSRAATRHAGSNATTRPATTAVAPANAITLTSMLTSLTRGKSSGAVRTNRLIASHATSSPSAPPIVASNSCSRTTWRTSRSRLAPSAVRTAASRSRPTVRVSDRLARFEHAISTTAAIAPSRSSSPRRARPTIDSSSGVIVPPSATASCVSRCAIPATACCSTSSSARAWSRVTPGRKRATTG